MGEFAKKADAWEQRLAAQQRQMNQVVPSTEQATALKALAKLKMLREQAYQLGYMLRNSNRKDPMQELLGNTTMSIPTREVPITLPAVQEVEKKALFGPILDPLKYALQSTRVGLSRFADEKIQEGRQVTDDPSTLWWYYPSVSMQAPRAFAEGYGKADEEETTKTHLALDERISKAREQYERALKDEYNQSRKAASAGELIDGLAKFHVKHAEGELNTGAGMYLALASLLGQGSYYQAKRWTEEHDPRVLQIKAMKDLIKQRMRSQPPLLRVGPSEEVTPLLPHAEEPAPMALPQPAEAPAEAALV